MLCFIYECFEMCFNPFNYNETKNMIFLSNFFDYHDIVFDNGVN